MQTTSILQTRAAYQATGYVELNIDQKEQHFWLYYQQQLADTLKYILKDLFVCIVKEHCSDKWQSTRRQ